MKSHLNVEQTLGLAVALTAMMKIGFGIPAGCNVRDSHRTAAHLSEPLGTPLMRNGSPMTRVEVGGALRKVSVMIPTDGSRGTVLIHGIAQWEWFTQDGSIVLSDYMDLR